jgi:hypothetical protein
MAHEDHINNCTVTYNGETTVANHIILSKGGKFAPENGVLKTASGPLLYVHDGHKDVNPHPTPDKPAYVEKVRNKKKDHGQIIIMAMIL